MTLVELKKTLTTGNLPKSFLIMINSPNNNFLANQYMETMSAIAQNGSKRITSIYDTINDSVNALLDDGNTLYVLNVDVFNERAEDYSIFENTLVICNSVDKHLLTALEPFMIKLPKLEQWQILDYIKQKCSGLSTADLTWLITATGGNMDWLMNEVAKISIFPAQEQPHIFSTIQNDHTSGFYTSEYYKVVDAIVTGDSLQLFNFLLNGGGHLFEAVGLASGAYSKLKSIIMATQNQSAKAEDLGMSAKQLGFFRNNYRNINVSAAIAKLDFLAKFDFDLKTSKLDLDKRSLLSYLISNTAYRITR